MRGNDDQGKQRFRFRACDKRLTKCALRIAICAAVAVVRLNDHDSVDLAGVGCIWLQEDDVSPALRSSARKVVLCETTCANVRNSAVRKHRYSAAYPG